MLAAQTLKCLMVALFLGNAIGLDLLYSDITAVDDTTRYTATHPDATLVPFDRVRHGKGNYLFTDGVRYNGDRLILAFQDETHSTKPEDVEVLLYYPAKGQNGLTLTAIEVYVDQSSDIAEVFMVGGGINKKYAEMLLTCSKTLHYTYEIFIYGY